MAIADGKVSLKHLVTMETLTNEEVLGLIRRGGDFKNGRADFQLDRQYFAANLFFENSTRTHKSFEVAEKKLGLDVIEFCLLYTSPSPRDMRRSRMPSSA